MATDAIIAEEMAVRGAKELRQRGIEVLILPTLSYAVSYASSPFPGTMNISPASLQALVTDIGRRLDDHGMRYLLVASSHIEPAHLQSLQQAAYTLEWESQLKVAVLDIRESRWAERLSEEFRRGARHAGAYGTSLVWAARPDLVNIEVARQLPPVWIDLLAAVRAGARTFVDAGAKLAYFGDPAKASPEEGERLYKALGSIIADAMEELLRR